MRLLFASLTATLLFTACDLEPEAVCPMACGAGGRCDEELQRCVLAGAVSCVDNPEICLDHERCHDDMGYCIDPGSLESYRTIHTEHVTATVDPAAASYEVDVRFVVVGNDELEPQLFLGVAAPESAPWSVTDVTDSDGVPLPFTIDEHGLLEVHLSEALAAREAFVVRVLAHGNIVDDEGREEHGLVSRTTSGGERVWMTSDEGRTGTWRPWAPFGFAEAQRLLDVRFAGDEEDVVMSAGEVLLDERYPGGWRRVVQQRRLFGQARFAAGRLRRHDLGQVQDVAMTFWAPTADFEGELSTRLVEEATRGLEALVGLLGPHPYDTLEVAVLPVREVGGYASHSLAVVDDELLPAYARAVLLHELGHQWFGVAAPAATGNEWLSEGLAEYVSAVAAARLDEDPSSYDHAIVDWANGCFYQPEACDEEPLQPSSPTSRSSGHQRVAVYTKGPGVLHMLGRKLGDEVLHDFLGLYASSARTWGYMTTTMFLSELGSFAGEDLSPFANEWIYRRGWPKVRFFFEDPATWTFSAEQVQTSEDGAPFTLSGPLAPAVRLWTQRDDGTLEECFLELPITEGFSSGPVTPDCPAPIVAMSFLLGAPRIFAEIAGFSPR